VFAGTTRIATQDFKAASQGAQRALVRAAFAPSPEVRYLTILLSDDKAGVRGYTLRVPGDAAAVERSR
jgi:hypothetical protein